ncbi:hypothetical protein GE21DRAFT_3565 [Neurospora crassa]|uniref:Uncharacterized protein n=1 Tax=Neurospora crassa (strain ATCC 24698 / 74-OR23-1A / CBS 708.71 / DSM 1257 / FGSC 987) TaxID=367110 RepID=Q7SC55_NEUCR|nr:hypothetical protein NCU08455 [Neurospora crassa OR74A]EAA34062.1 hypothetical protein NCU08455 [Neurospora crassa OR74A]KHE80166.1 hypothetical protein GE21DRAFT_3565 [Neurospora crassa]|eukprot:XP_963298.1 hypothetical protein NCU08455 [Neurospora crassa OR74A]
MAKFFNTKFLFRTGLYQIIFTQFASLENPVSSCVRIMGEDQCNDITPELIPKNPQVEPSMLVFQMHADTQWPWQIPHSLHTKYMLSPRAHSLRRIQRYGHGCGASSLPEQRDKRRNVQSFVGKDMSFYKPARKDKQLLTSSLGAPSKSRDDRGVIAFGPRCIYRSL